MKSVPGAALAAVRHHDGAVGTEDLDPAVHGWMEPVAEFTTGRTG